MQPKNKTLTTVPIWPIDVVGVIGSNGDLGAQLVSKLKQHNKSVLECDISNDNSNSLESIFQAATIIHVCVALRNLVSLPAPKNGQLVILHDSVMNSSRVFNIKLDNKAAIVHMLMNKERVVVIAKESSQQRRLINHFKQLGMKPKLLSVIKHDELMARTQAPLALLIRVLIPILTAQQKNGMLTDSAHALLDVLQSRQLSWTKETISSILANPQLSNLINDMQSILRSKV